MEYGSMVHKTEDLVCVHFKKENWCLGDNGGWALPLLGGFLGAADRPLQVLYAGLDGPRVLPNTALFRF